MRFLGKHMPNGLQIKQMLDVGGSMGVFADKVCKLTGANGVVVDPSKDEINKASERGLTCCCSSFMDYKTDKKFELISMMRTIEHLPSITDAFNKVKGLLASDGVFLLDIVNHEWLVRMFHRVTWSTKIDHIYQLTDKTVRQYLDKCFPNYEIVSSDVSLRYILYLVKPCSKTV